MSNASLTPPEADQRPVRAHDRIGLRQGDARDRFERLCVTVRCWTLQVHPWAWRIGADNGEIRARRDALMPGARGQDCDIAGGNVELAAVIAAEAYAGVPARDAQHLM